MTYSQKSIWNRAQRRAKLGSDLIYIAKRLKEMATVRELDDLETDLRHDINWLQDDVRDLQGRMDDLQTELSTKEDVC